MLETYNNIKIKFKNFFFLRQYQNINSLLAKVAQLNLFASTDNMTSWDYLSALCAFSGKQGH